MTEELAPATVLSVSVPPVMTLPSLPKIRPPAVIGPLTVMVPGIPPKIATSPLSQFTVSDKLLS